MKVGDNVRVVKSPYGLSYLIAGNTGVIVSIEPGPEGLLNHNVQFEIDERDFWPFYAEELEIVQ